MEFRSYKELKSYLKYLNYVGQGSQGICFLRKKDNKVLKTFHYINDADYSNCESDKSVLKFSNIKNSTFIWPIETIKIGGEIIGYITKYVDAKSLYTKDPLRLKLDTFERSIQKVRKDIHIISENGIATYDMMYNNLYGSRFLIVDEDEYSFSPKDPQILEEENNRKFDIELYYFLIDGYFNGIINDDPILKELYISKKEDILTFIKYFRNRLNDMCEKEISHLSEAREFMDKKPIEQKYLRELKKDF